MKRFYCHCGQELFFDSTICSACGRSVGYDLPQRRMVTIEQAGTAWHSLQDGAPYRLCENRSRHNVCNGLIGADDPERRCLSCRLNRTIPDITLEENLTRWGKLENAKRRLVSGLLSLNLPLEAPVAGYPRGLCFDFLEDRRSNPLVPNVFVTTGHRNGVITINVLEADDVQRVWQREQSSERYRTLLGHFRHEAGHYYFELLVSDRAEFGRLFGDPWQPYEKALKRYYANGPLPGWEHDHISAYASAHPQEDWAESFAHYLHMCETLETAALRGVVPHPVEPGSIDEMLRQWDELAVTLNELNRGLGLNDAYPFVVTPTVAQKLRFVHAAITNRPG